MKVKDIIKELEKFDPEYDVELQVEYLSDYENQTVSEWAASNKITFSQSNGKLQIEGILEE